MSKKNSGFAADLAAGIDLTDEAAAPRRSSIASNVLTGRSNRLAASLHMVDELAIELVQSVPAAHIALYAL